MQHRFRAPPSGGVRGPAGRLDRNHRQRQGRHMSKDEREFTHESLQDRESIMAYLQAIQDGLARGTLTFSDEEGEITLEPSPLLNFQLQASRKRDRVRLTLGFSWKESQEKDPKLRSLDIRGQENGTDRS
ncbi:MAG: amphi-Trp domain-containing protein [Candidatus Eisenbacteria bacterium]|nr:amphi-Trp domain-containing protein [Candidatus Eisenbacteria bacterium]